MRFGQIVGSSSRLHGKLIFLQKCGFTIAPMPRAAHRRETPWGSLFAPCAQIPPCQCLIWRSDWLPRRILASNSPLPVPDLALLALPTGFRRASWPPTPPCQCLIWRSWPFRLASDANLRLHFPLAASSPAPPSANKPAKTTAVSSNLRPSSFPQRGGCAKHHE